MKKNENIKKNKKIKEKWNRNETENIFSFIFVPFFLIHFVFFHKLWKNIFLNHFYDKKVKKYEIFAHDGNLEKVSFCFKNRKFDKKQAKTEKGKRVRKKGKKRKKKWKKVTKNRKNEKRVTKKA